MDDDFLFALRLQEQYDLESLSTTNDLSFPLHNEAKKRKIDSDLQVVPVPRARSTSLNPERPLSIVDESWEMLDPNPDIRAMFLQFNDLFFWGKLSSVEVKWSPRMTLCAGVCSYEGRGGLCSIRLSEPLLKLRPRRDLVETLLHEMIHAVLFVTQNNRDRDGHGPEFCKHMNRINSASGTKITIYHSFHDEVDLYRQHWWRCTGPCQSRKPFFGYVKRSMNRAPSSNDTWWEEHQRTCGGKFIKIKEPENYKKDETSKNVDSKRKPSAKNLPKKCPSNDDKGIKRGVDIRTVIPFSGKGVVLGGNTSKPPEMKSTPPSQGPPVAVVDDKKECSVPKTTDTTKATSSMTITTAWLKSSTNILAKQPQPTGKKSVANVSAFRNVNGSPIRVSTSGNIHFRSHRNNLVGGHHSTTTEPRNMKTVQSLEKPGTSLSTSTLSNVKKLDSPIKASQRSLFDSYFKNPSVVEKNTTSRNTEDKKMEKSSQNIVKDVRQQSPKDSVDSDYFKSKAFTGKASSITNPRKRPHEESHSNQISDFFSKNKKTGDKQPSASTSQNYNLPSGDPEPKFQEGARVNCPVCRVSVLESAINVHLDSCLLLGLS
ncbi:DNA-dependent metalloprotease SPRTN [Erpetoichthys calabaricus]|uniref:DNA-dependent metalloprotease SPRTN n=1 Tax=Erpetoichthys calabaricus TaxID=27687 RepID=UPI002234AA78|nr:DNA-dependent metalloprotease SPRTN [Erpetoichthys calabaricus]